MRSDLAIAISKDNWQDAGKRQAVQLAICEFMGVPKSLEGWDVAKKVFNPQPRDDVFGNISYGVIAGSDWYVVADDITNFFGTNDGAATSRLDTLKADPAAEYMLIAEFCPQAELWLREWGVYVVEEELVE